MSTEYLELLRDRINLREIPYTERGSRLLVFQSDGHFSIRLAERWFKRNGQLSAYRQRPPVIEKLYFTDERENPLELTLTTYPHQIDCHTSKGKFILTFLDNETLMICLPAGKLGLSFQANVDQAQTDRRGGVMRITGEIRRNIAYTTNAKILMNESNHSDPAVQRVRLIVESDGCQAILLNITPRLGYNRYVPEIHGALGAAAQRWQAWFAGVPPVADEYRTQYAFAWWVMRAGLISTRYYTTREAMTPSKFYYLGVWSWDAYFHALAYRYIEPRLAQDQLRILIDHQREDGMLPDAVHDEGVVTHLDFPVEADVTKPPLIAWAAWKLYQTSKDREFLEEIYEPLVRWNHWWFEKNDLDHNGLCEYTHPFSSGLDDSPLWDEGMPVESPDLNTYLCIQCESLSRIAHEIGEESMARQWAKLADEIAARMTRILWDESSGLFWARRQGQPVRVKTPFSLFPLVTGRMPPRTLERLIAHLVNEREFWPRYPVPTVALDDPKYNPTQMWRGPTWTNVNYLLIEGLRRCGRVRLANELRRKTLEMISNHADIYEYYHPESGEIPPKAAPIFGWSSAIFIELALQATKEIEAK